MYCQILVYYWYCDIINNDIVYNNIIQDLIVDLAKRVEKLERVVYKMTEMMETMSEWQGQKSSDCRSKIVKEDPENTVGGVNVMRLPSRDAYSFALQLLDILFTKEEQGTSLLFKSKKSEKPGLDRERVEKLLSFVERRYGDDWDIRTLTSKANQKCRDAAKQTLTQTE